jgi:hypothetical protein
MTFWPRSPRAAPGIPAAAGLSQTKWHIQTHDLPLHPKQNGSRAASCATMGRDAKIDWKALSTRIGHSDVAFTMNQYVQTDLEADRQVANTLAELIIGGSLVSVDSVRPVPTAQKPA